MCVCDAFFDFKRWEAMSEARAASFGIIIPVALRTFVRRFARLRPEGRARWRPVRYQYHQSRRIDASQSNDDVVAKTGLQFDAPMSTMILAPACSM